MLSNLGVNAIGPGEIAVTIGTSGALRAAADRPPTNPAGRTFCYALTDRHWVIGGPVNNGGIVFRWVRDELTASVVETAKRLGIEPYEVLTRIAERVAPGAEGLLFHRRFIAPFPPNSKPNTTPSPPFSGRRPPLAPRPEVLRRRP